MRRTKSNELTITITNQKPFTNSIGITSEFQPEPFRLWYISWNVATTINT